MPSKDIEKRREAWRKWYAKNKANPEVQGKRRARDAAFQKLPTQSCSIGGCEKTGERHHGDYSKPLDIVWLCKTHHEQIHSKTKCLKCDKPHRALGLCYNHWRQEHRKKTGKN